MYVNDDARGAGKHRATCPSKWRRTVRSGMLSVLVVPIAVTTMAVSSTTTPTVALPTRLLATHALAPTQQAGISVIRGDDLINLFRPWATDAFIKHTGDPDAVLPEPFAEDYYPANGDADSETQGVATLKASVAADLADGADPVVIIGLSQGARVIALYKQQFNEEYQEGDPIPTFVVIGNSSRPNGGMWTRLASLGIPSDDAVSMPTETSGAGEGVITTYDYVHQYDWYADFPNRPLNPFSLVNALFGIFLSHASYGPLTADNGLAGLIEANNPYGTVSPADAISQGQYGDTQYYLMPSKALPMLQPLAFIGVPKPVIAALDAPLRVLVEAGYDRTVSPGQPTPAQLIPFGNPVQTAVNFANAIPTGLDDALEQVGQGRPFGTTAAGPYGVGGPPVTVAPAASAADEEAAKPASVPAQGPDTETAASDTAPKPVDRVRAAKHRSIKDSRTAADQNGESSTGTSSATETTTAKDADKTSDSPRESKSGAESPTDSVAKPATKAGRGSASGSEGSSGSDSDGGSEG